MARARPYGEPAIHLASSAPSGWAGPPPRFGNTTPGLGAPPSQTRASVPPRQGTRPPPPYAQSYPPSYAYAAAPPAPEPAAWPGTPPVASTSAYPASPVFASAARAQLESSSVAFRPRGRKAGLVLSLMALSFVGGGVVRDALSAPDGERVHAVIAAVGRAGAGVIRSIKGEKPEKAPSKGLPPSASVAPPTPSPVIAGPVTEAAAPLAAGAAASAWPTGAVPSKVVAPSAEPPEVSFSSLPHAATPAPPAAPVHRTYGHAPRGAAAEEAPAFAPAAPPAPLPPPPSRVQAAAPVVAAPAPATTSTPIFAVRARSAAAPAAPEAVKVAAPPKAAAPPPPVPGSLEDFMRKEVIREQAGKK